MQTRLEPFARENILRTLLILLIIATLLVFWGGVILSALQILFGAALIAFLVSPIGAFFERRMARPVASLFALLAAGAAVIVLIGVLLPVMARQLGGIIEMLPGALSRLQPVIESIAQWLRRILPGLSLPRLDALQSSIGGIARNTISYAGSIAGGIYRLVLMVILSYFLLSGRNRALLQLELLIPSPYRRIAVRMGGSLIREWRLYLRCQITIALAVGALAGLGLTIIGVKAAPLLGLIVGICNVIPYFGPFIGGIPAVIMALSASWQRAGLAVLVLFLVQQIDGFVLSPRIMGSITGFSPGVVLLSLYLGQEAFGIPGMILAMPLLMSCRTIYRVFVQSHENN